MKLVNSNKKSNIVVILACVLMFAVPLLLTIVTRNYRYSSLSIKVVGFIVYIGSILYTYNVFEKQIKNNTYFGITRRETYGKWSTKIVLLGLYVILINIINNILACILIPDMYNNFYELLSMISTGLGGFYLYFLLNYTLFYEIANTIDVKKRKIKTLSTMIIGFLTCLFFSFIIYICSAISANLEFGIFVVFITDILVGPIILIVGLSLLLGFKKSIFRGEY